MLFPKLTSQTSPSRSEHSIWSLPSLTIDALHFQARTHQLNTFPRGKIRGGVQHCVTPLLLLTAPLLSLPSFQSTAIAHVENPVLQTTAAGGTDKTTETKQTRPKPFTFVQQDHESLFPTSTELNPRPQPPVKESKGRGAESPQTDVSSTTSSRQSRSSGSGPLQTSGYSSSTVSSVATSHASTSKTPDVSCSAKAFSEALTIPSHSRTHTTSQRSKKPTSPSFPVRSPGSRLRVLGKFLTPLARSGQSAASKPIIRQPPWEDQEVSHQNVRQLRDTPERMARRSALYFAQISKKKKKSATRVSPVAGTSAGATRMAKTRNTLEGGGKNGAPLLCARQAAILGFPTRFDHKSPKKKTTNALQDRSIETRSSKRHNSDVFGCLNCPRQRLTQVGCMADLLNATLNPEGTHQETASSLTDILSGRIETKSIWGNRNDSLSRTLSLPNLAFKKIVQSSPDLVGQGREEAHERKWAPLQSVACYHISCKAVERSALLWLVACVLKARGHWNRELEKFSENLMYFGEALLKSNEDPGNEKAMPPHQDDRQCTPQGRGIEEETLESNKGPPEGYFAPTLADIAQAAQARVRKNYAQWNSSGLQDIFRDWGKEIKDECLKLKLCSKRCLCYQEPERTHGPPRNRQTSSVPPELPCRSCGCHACNPFFARDARRFIGGFLLDIYNIPQKKILKVQSQEPVIHRQPTCSAANAPSSALTCHDAPQHLIKRKPTGKRSGRVRQVQADKRTECGSSVYRLLTCSKASNMPELSSSAMTFGTKSQHVTKPRITTISQHPNVSLNNSTKSETNPPQSNAMNLKLLKASDIAAPQATTGHPVPSHVPSQITLPQAKTNDATTQYKVQQLGLKKECLLRLRKKSPASRPVSHSKPSISNVSSPTALTTNGVSPAGTSRLIKTGLARFLTIFKSEDTPQRTAVVPKEQPSTQSPPSATASTTRGPTEQDTIQTSSVRFEPTRTGVWKAPQRLRQQPAQAALVHRNSSQGSTRDVPNLRSMLKSSNLISSCGKPIRGIETLCQRGSPLATGLPHSKHIPNKNHNRKKAVLPSLNSIRAWSQVPLPSIPTASSKSEEQSPMRGRVSEPLIVPTVASFSQFSVTPEPSGMQHVLTTAGRQNFTTSSEAEGAAMNELLQRPSTSTQTETQYSTAKALVDQNLSTRANRRPWNPTQVWQQSFSLKDSSTQTSHTTCPSGSANPTLSRNSESGFWTRLHPFPQSISTEMETPLSRSTSAVDKYLNTSANSGSSSRSPVSQWSFSPIEKNTKSATTSPLYRDVNNQVARMSTTPHFSRYHFTPTHSSTPIFRGTPLVYRNPDRNSECEALITPETWKGSLTPIERSIPSSTTTTPVHLNFNSSPDSEISSTPHAWQDSFIPIFNNMHPFTSDTPVQQPFTSSSESETASLNDTTRHLLQIRQDRSPVLSGCSHFRPYSPSTRTKSTTAESSSENSDANQNSTCPIGLREFFV